MSLIGPLSMNAKAFGANFMQPSDTTKETPSSLLAALKFAAHKHSRQRRKDLEATPYINHPIAVAEVLSRVGEITDLPTLQAAILHDTIEDTETSPQELEDYFGQEVRFLVQEVTDDKSLPKQERKRLQIEHAPKLSTPAKLIKIGDKICNVGEITATQPAEWPLQRKLEYLDWAERVVSGCRDCNLDLEQHFDAVLRESRESLRRSKAAIAK
jgi:(p)ppGpp synthase/HD superfamily hydrolase